MNRQRIGKSLFWFGVISVIVWQALTWIQSPIQRVHTSAELVGTVHEIWGVLFWVRIVGGSGLTFALLGVLLTTGREGSWFWLLGLLPNVITFGQYWQPARHIPELFGIGGTAILISYFGILWMWSRTHGAYEGAARTGRNIQILGISILVTAALLLCLYFGNQKQLALDVLPIPSSEIINLSLGLGMFVLFLGHYVANKAVQETVEHTRTRIGNHPDSPIMGAAPSD